MHLTLETRAGSVVVTTRIGGLVGEQDYLGVGKTRYEVYSPYANALGCMVRGRG